MQRISDEVLLRHHVLVGTDNAFQRRARLLQAIWREERGLPIGTHRSAALGSRVEEAHARTTLSNFLTDGIRDVVRHAVLGAGRVEGQLIQEDRLFANLLSSQPLCFNLFGELARDLELATRVLHELAPERVERVTSLVFEHSPGRGDARFTDDRSAFDVFITYDSTRGTRGFFGIEVKYHEALGDPAASHRARYDELAASMGCFVSDRSALEKPPLQQIWRDHLLAGAMLDASLGYDEGVFVFLAPTDNVACRRAVARYRKHLTNEESFAAWSLEEVVAAIQSVTRAHWADELHDRYLAFSRIDALIDRESDRTPCPECGHVGSIPILPGEPSAEAERMARRREVALGGCLEWPDMPTRRCAACEHEWAPVRAGGT